MIVVPMTATPPEGVSDTDVIRLGPKDRQNPGLDNRLKAAKWTKLLTVSDIVQAATTEAASTNSKPGAPNGFATSPSGRRKK